MNRKLPIARGAIKNVVSYTIGGAFALYLTLNRGVMAIPSTASMLTYEHFSVVGNLSQTDESKGPFAIP